MFAWWLLINIFKTTKKLLQVILGSKNSYLCCNFDNSKIFVTTHWHKVCYLLGTNFQRTLSKKLFFFKSSQPDVFLGKCILKICSKLTGEHPCQTAISIKLQSTFIEITLRHGCSPINLLHIFRTFFPKNSSGRLLLFFAYQDDLVLCKK